MDTERLLHSLGAHALCPYAPGCTLTLWLIPLCQNLLATVSILQQKEQNGHAVTGQVLLSQLQYPALPPAQLSLSYPLLSAKTPRAVDLELAPAACRVVGNSLCSCLCT